MFNMLKSILLKSLNNIFSNQYTIIAVYSHMHSNEQNQIHDECIENAAELNPNIENSNNDNILITSSVLRPVDEIIPDVQSVIENEVQDAPLYTLRRKTTEPVQMHTEY